MPNVDEVAAKFVADYGDSVGGKGSVLPSPERVATGIAPFDLDSGGGFPVGLVSTVYGVEGTGKTTLALKAVAWCQRHWPELSCAWVDAENSLDPGWAARLGVDVDRLYVFRPSYGEQAVDILAEFLEASDAGLTVLDSLAALVAVKILDVPADKDVPAAQARLISRLVSRTTHALQEQRKAGGRATLIYVNQIRTRMNVVYGAPTHAPGGYSPRFQSSLTVRLWGKREVDGAVSKVLPARLRQTGHIEKYRVQVFALQPEWDLVLFPHKGMPVGYCDDWPKLLSYMRMFGLLEKAGKKGWSCPIGDFPKQSDIRYEVQNDEEAKAKLLGAIIEEATSRVQESGILDFSAAAAKKGGGDEED